MTRVEKYREYRSEIAALPDLPKNTKKRQSSQRVERILSQSQNKTKLAFEDVYGGLDIYNVSNEDKNKKHYYGLTNYILFYVIMSVIIVGLIIALVFVGKSAFGG